MKEQANLNRQGVEIEGQKARVSDREQVRTISADHKYALNARYLVRYALRP